MIANAKHAATSLALTVAARCDRLIVLRISLTLCAFALAGLASSGCVPPAVDPAFRMDRSNFFDRALLRGRYLEEKAEIARAEIESLAKPDPSIIGYERLLASLGAACRREGHDLQCRYAKQVRSRSALTPSHATQYEFEINVAGTGLGTIAVCLGTENNSAQNDDLSDIPSYFRPRHWRCSPATAMSDDCRAVAHKSYVDRFPMNCGP